MTNEEIERYREELTDIIGKIDGSKPDDSELKRQLCGLAVKVGAFTFEYVMTSSGPKWHRATLEKLVYNIQEALRTASMIHACRTAARNYRVAFVAAVIALFAAVAAWGGAIIDCIRR